MKKFLLSMILSVAGLCMASANEPIKGIFATYDGSEVSYKLSEVPSVKYEVEEGVKYAVLYLKGITTPALKVALAEGKTLTVVYGEITPTGIGGVVADKATISEKAGKKFIKGGKLIIIGKNGKMYNAAGIEIKE